VQLLKDFRLLLSCLLSGLLELFFEGVSLLLDDDNWWRAMLL
jgi:hypothetical protein